MNLHAFYNNENIGDVLLVRLGERVKVTQHTSFDDLCVLYHNDEIVGYNLFNASQYMSNLVIGKIKIDETFVEEFNNVLNRYELPVVESDYDDKFRVGKVVEIEEHPDSDHMHICKVDIGNEVLQIVCGAPNVALNQLVVAALEGAVMPSGLIIVPSSLRGVASAGMLCSARELNLPNAPQVRGILVLNENEYKVGDSFFK